MEIQQVAIEHTPVAADELQILMEKKIDEVPGNPFEARPVTIFRFPAWFYNINKDLCEPQIVSIGPYHHGKESLRAMEEYKWSIFRDFLACNQNVGIEVYLREMRLLEYQARECYSETVNLGSNDFVMMLLLDGCFILEYLSKLRRKQRSDAFLFAEWVLDGISSDLFLLENQMPFFVIHKLLAIQGECGQNCEVDCPMLTVIQSRLICPAMIGLYLSFPEISCSKIHHLLYLLQIGMLPDREQSNLVTDKPYLRGLRPFPWPKIFSKIFPRSKSRADKPTISNIPCVAELHEAGVKFKRKRTPRDMFDISFQNGIMEMPTMLVASKSNTCLWNMVAFEQSQPAIPLRDKILSSYLGLMDSLINTEKDVAILVRSGIIENYLQNEEQVANFFNQFGPIFVLDYDDHYFYGLYKDVKRYSQSTRHKYRARLMHDYFSNPWSVISVLAASILLILTFIQTYYSAAK